MHSPASTSDPVLALVSESAAEAPAKVLQHALDQAGFWESLERSRAGRKVDKSQFTILILPNLSGYSADSRAVTDPRLVEVLVDLLYEHGFEAVTLCAAADSSLLWAENRDIFALADLLGYRFITDNGNAYDFTDLGEDLMGNDLPPGAALHGHPIAKAWVQADWRISFAKNKTDEMEGFALGLDNLLGVLPQVDKDYFYHHKWKARDVACELLKISPIDFALIDSIHSVHGSSGSRAPQFLQTNAIIASSDLLLTDFVAALKMGADPYASSLNKNALAEFGLPDRYQIIGNLGPYENWTPVSPVVSESVKLRESAVTAARAVKPWLQVLDPEIFPLKRSIDAQINSRAAPLFARIDSETGVKWLYAMVNYLIWYAQNSIDVYRTLLDKDALRRREVPLGIDPEAYGERAYTDIPGELLPLVDLVKDLEPDSHGLRWRYLDEAVIFEFARTVPVDFEEFVAKVDVSKTIQLMYDYVGGVVVPLTQDDQGRTVTQAERNLYLPQPNYLALHQGQVIDVTKLEYAEYLENHHRLYWKTVKSENDSARYDDGIATFSRVSGETRISIAGRQQFNLPPYWQQLQLDLNPELKGSLVEHAYRTFFQRTVANLEAVVEGREIAIGRPWVSGDDIRSTEPLPSERLEELFGALVERYQDRLGDGLGGLLRRRRPAAPANGAVDRDGFIHFQGTGAGTQSPEAPPADSAAFVEQQMLVAIRHITEFASQYNEAILRDVRDWGGFQESENA